MSVTLEVSQLSGWLKAIAFCRGSQVGHTVSGVANIHCMSVTLEVFQLSGWLKAVADCRGLQAGHTVRGGLWAGTREAASERGLHAAGRGEGCDCRDQGRSARGAAHVKHGAHVRDA